MRKTINQITQTFQGDRPFDWKEIAPAFYGASSLFEAIEGVLVAGTAAKQASLPEYPPVTKSDFQGIFKNGTAYETSQRFRAFIKNLGISILYQDIEPEVGTGEKIVAACADTVVRANFSRNDSGVTVSTTNAAIQAHFTVWASENLTEEERKGTVYVLTSGSSGLEFEELGYGGAPLVKENYAPEVLVAFDRLLQELRIAQPHGRLSILEGPPGSGKTFLVRALLEDLAEHVTLVLIPATLVEQLAGPGGIGAIMKFRVNRPGRPLVFILEDADIVLAPRNGANMSLVSSLLNMGDGIVGATLDIRLICTTNATQIELDPAVKRPGRLSVLEHVGKLPAEQATGILRRLTKNDTLSMDQDSTLAEIYQKAYDIGFKVPKTNERKIGFS